MNNVVMSFPNIYETLYRELQSIPMYKTDTGYAFAGFLLDSTEHPTEIASFLASEGAVPGLTNESADHGRALFRKAIEDLSALCITDDALVGWQTFQKEVGDVETYHRILSDLYDDLMLERFRYALETDDTEETPIPEEKTEEMEKTAAKLMPIQGDWIPIPSLQLLWESSRSVQPISSEVVLNHNNPFADISIKEQSFIYGSVLGQFESLGLTTSHTLTKVAKDTEKSYLALQPGFKIKRSKHIEKQEKQDVIFDDTLTTEVAQNDDNIYVYIN